MRNDDQPIVSYVPAQKYILVCCLFVSVVCKRLVTTGAYSSPVESSSFLAADISVGKLRNAPNNGRTTGYISEQEGSKSTETKNTIPRALPISILKIEMLCSSHGLPDAKGIAEWEVM